MFDSEVGSTTFLPNGEGDRLLLSGAGSGLGAFSTFEGFTTFDFLSFPSFLLSSFSFFFSFFFTSLLSVSTEFLS
jgi:hypothetical protein